MASGGSVWTITLYSQEKEKGCMSFAWGEAEPRSEPGDTSPIQPQRYGGAGPGKKEVLSE